MASDAKVSPYYMSAQRRCRGQEEEREAKDVDGEEGSGGQSETEEEA